MAGSFLQGDLLTLLASSDFGEASETVTWKGVYVAGIFDDDDVEVQLGEGHGEIIAQPTFTGKTADFQGIADGDPMVIRGDTFKVKNWKAERDGLIEIFLERQ